MAVVIGLYMLANAASLRVLPVGEIARSERVAAVVADRTLGRVGGALFAVTILISIAGSINGSILSTPRGYFAQARDGLFFRSFGRVHPRFGTPGVSVLVSSVWSAVLALTGTYEVLYSYVVFTAWIFYGMTAFAVVVLRRKMPGLRRPYRMHGYPWTPVLFAGVSFWFVGNTLVTETRSSVIGLGILAVGVPVYWLWTVRQRAGRAVLPSRR
jgi:APA family basic amino acid/polyamine antiporter